MGVPNFSGLTALAVIGFVACVMFAMALTALIFWALLPWRWAVGTAAAIYGVAAMLAFVHIVRRGR